VYAYLTAAEQLQVVSADVDDQGSTVSSGTATGGSTTTLVDSGANFVGDGVAVGDLVINDTEKVHGIVSVVATTTLTVAIGFEAGASDFDVEDAIPFESGDTYRVVNANDTGAAVVKLSGLDGSYVRLTEYVVLNGQTDVTTTASFLRIFRAFTVLAGSSGWNEGNISIENNASAVLLSQITAQLNQTLMAMWTVPAGFTFFLVDYYAGTSSNKVSLVDLYVRPFGETFQLKRRVTINQGTTRHIYPLPLPVAERSDITVRASAAAGGGAVSAGFNGWYE